MINAVSVIGEENIVGEWPQLPGLFPHADGYSVLTHEFAHLIWEFGLTAEQRQRVVDWFDVKRPHGNAVRSPGRRLLEPLPPRPRQAWSAELLRDDGGGVLRPGRERLPGHEHRP